MQNNSNLPKSNLPIGIQHFEKYLNEEEQIKLVNEIRKIVALAPLFQPTMPKTGKPLSVKMTNCGEFGWVSDQHRGYRYQKHHPMTNTHWPPIPKKLVGIWHELTRFPRPPQACLINHYTKTAKMGLHQDKDEKDFSAPVVSISLGDSCLFRVGGTRRNDKTISFKLHSGDVVILGGPARLAHHGVDRIYPNTSALLINGGRLNLTLRICQ